MMKIDIKGILEGAKNSIFIKDEVEAIAKERISICRRCDFNSEVAKEKGENILRGDEHCLKCGCNLHLKTRALSAQCPLDPPKWTALATNEESMKIMEVLEKNNTDEKE